jgi:hypothetical protein
VASEANGEKENDRVARQKAIQTQKGPRADRRGQRLWVELGDCIHTPEREKGSSTGVVFSHSAVTINAMLSWVMIMGAYA